MGPSAVVVTYNSSGVIGDCLESAAAAGVSDLWIVDNASVDSTVAVAREVAADVGLNLEVLQLETNVGFGAAVNRAADRVGGDLLLLNPDLLLTAEAYEALVNGLDRDSGAGCVSCRLQLSDGSIDLACNRRIPSPASAAAYYAGRYLPGLRRLSSYHPGRDAYFADDPDVEAVNGALMLLRRDAWDAIGGFDERYFMYGEDLDLCMALRRAGWRVAFIGSVAAVHLKGRSSGVAVRSGAQAVAFEDAMRLFYEKWFVAGSRRGPKAWAVRLLLHARAMAVLGPAGYRRYLRRVRERPETDDVLAPERDTTGGTGHLRPEVAAGGYSARDGTVDFYQRVHAVLPERGVVLDFGAGRGQWMEAAGSHRRRLRDLRSEHRVVIGVDVDTAVAANLSVDACVLIAPDGRLPFRDGAVDVVVADAVFEHVADPEAVAAELRRIVRSGGWVCARTPNRYGYVGVGARAVPNALHERVLRHLQPHRREEDIFPVQYRMNSFRALRALFPERVWLHASYRHNPDAAYAGGRRWLAAVVDAWQKLAPAPMATVLHVFMRRS